jgi:hypothetical protein
MLGRQSTPFGSSPAGVQPRSIGVMRCFAPRFERQFEVLGEALNNLRRVTPAVAERIPSWGRSSTFVIC